MAVLEVTMAVLEVTMAVLEVTMASLRLYRSECADDGWHECTGEERQCRICFEGAEEEDLVRPCACRGSAAFIHIGCLKEWHRSTVKQSLVTQSGRVTTPRCKTCKQPYVGHVAVPVSQHESA
jgi:hypothetical protein